ncbi:MAG TPA: MFS transporter [Pseudonocardiaceae bacterium]|jgi:sugar phosphate permease|nr:MFS transporter [Pseudonocardiaceae bacterium]
MGRRRWLILALGVAAQTSACSLIYGLPFLVPAMRAAEHLSLARAGVVVSAPTVGLLFTLIAWGALADRHGERIVIATGMLGCGALTAVAVLMSGLTGFTVLLVLAGAAGASVNAASGRVVMGWFAAHERGVAMGVRQTAQPLGVGIAALFLPSLAQAYGFRHALWLPAGLCLLCGVLVAVLVVDPPRPRREPGEPAAGSPYRTPTLWRLHSASAMLVVPQFAIAAFALEYLVGGRHWAPGSAGAFLTVVQVFGAVGRLGTGYWSDRVGSRLRPMRQLAIASAAVLGLAALGDLTGSWLILPAIAFGAVITVADNGLGFTATAELAGPFWAGRALGVQNTMQNITGALTPPVLGLVIGGSSYAVAFVVAAGAAVLAIGLTPVAGERGSAVTAVSSRAAGR